MKRIVICADGTWNLRDQVDDGAGRRAPTNVTKVARTVLPIASDKKTHQVVYYHAGVGTRGGIDKLTGGAFGSGMCENVRALYRFIIYNYVAGDELYLFGFSRGAFTVRTLAGFMRKVGLLEKDDDYWVPEIFSMYETSATFDWKSKFENITGTRECSPIKFMGVWDTVGALGAPGLIGQFVNRGKYKFHDIELNDYILNAYQALAIDEHRKPFLPNLWTRPTGWNGQLEQVWFPGAHSNIGGGYSPDGLANEALHWMVEKAEGLGLEFDRQVLPKYRPCFNSVRRDSMSMKYRVFGGYTRPIGEQRGDGEAVHRAAEDRWNLYGDYRPENLKVHIESQNPLPKTQSKYGSNGTACQPSSGSNEPVKSG